MTETLKKKLEAAKIVIDKKEYLEYSFVEELVEKLTSPAKITPEQKEAYAKYLIFINKTFGKQYRETKSLRNFAARLNEGWTGVEFKKAVENVKLDPYHIENNFKDATPAFFCRVDKLDKWMNAKSKPKEKVIKSDSVIGIPKYEQNQK